MQTITITQDDDGRLSVQSDAGGEPYECESPEECLEHVAGLLAGEPMADEAMDEAAMGEEPMGEEAYAQAWNEEASKRPPMA